MRNGKNPKFPIALFVALTATLAANEARSNGVPRQVTPNSAAHGFASVYGDLPGDQAENLSTSDRIKSAAASGAPTLVWEALEHGEKVECLDCISAVSPLLYDANGKSREIAAWWLRRRIFGVFGHGEVYEQTINTLADNNMDPIRRTYAAYALGEFLATPGIAACAQALVTDTDARVRAAAASALGRLNDDGGGALGTALGDADSRVKIAALGAAARINTFSGLAAVAGLTMDPSVVVRRRAIEVLDALRAKDAVVAVAAAAKNDVDAGVRAAACHALANLGDASVKSLVTTLAGSDPDTFVRDQAQIAVQRL
ncbi:MAG: HEAT repeat domain-containing protein [Myxococcota bacterium]|nr:HEAT repeat domain-containing protein [Myxococcota bacterium]